MMTMMVFHCEKLELSFLINTILIPMDLSIAQEQTVKL
jgi:hypothetical protein